ncbi:hypothetical protein [Steroidobacter cummioxidans]|uniref:hypothetical protein n=1 Tax=Steroidobacter cummioxidans TaxID=1803913 RepID=UPI00128FECCD|nr:hypothetical protein [Steroidobacter cummioxidans]
MLESLSYRDELAPPHAIRISDSTNLPEPLRALILNHQEPETAWLALADAPRIWFLTASPSVAQSRERQKPVLNVRLYNERGLFLEASHWVFTQAAGWQRCD